MQAEDVPNNMPIVRFNLLSKLMSGNVDYEGFVFMVFVPQNV